MCQSQVQISGTGTALWSLKWTEWQQQPQESNRPVLDLVSKLFVERLGRNLPTDPMRITFTLCNYVLQLLNKATNADKLREKKNMLYLPQVSVQQAISLLTDSVHVRSVRWAHTSRNQAGSSASPVEEVSWPSMKHRCPSETVKPKVRLCDRAYHFTSVVCFFPLYLFIVATTRQGARISLFYINNIFLYWQFLVLLKQRFADMLWRPATDYVTI